MPILYALQVFQLPKALAYPLFYKLVAPNSSSVTRDAILSWFDEKNVVQVTMSAVVCFLCGSCDIMQLTLLSCPVEMRLIDDSMLADLHSQNFA